MVKGNIVYKLIHSRLVHWLGWDKPDFYYERLKVCDKCSFNSKNVNKNIFQKIWEKLMGNNPFCTVCKCPLHLKAVEGCEVCDKGKWNHIESDC